MDELSSMAHDIIKQVYNNVTESIFKNQLKYLRMFKWNGRGYEISSKYLEEMLVRGIFDRDMSEKYDMVYEYLPEEENNA